MPAALFDRRCVFADQRILACVSAPRVTWRPVALRHVGRVRVQHIDGDMRRFRCGLAPPALCGLPNRGDSRRLRSDALQQ